MKKKGIIISLIGILLISGFILIIANEDKKNFIMRDGIMLALTLDGTSISEFPEGTNYRVEIDCANAKGIWLTDEWNLSISDITGDVTCNLDFHTKTESDNLINIVESKATSTPTTIYTVTYDENDKLSLEDYSNLSNDETNPFVYNSSTNIWELSTSVPVSMSFELEPGFYQLCFKGYDPDDNYIDEFSMYDDDWYEYYSFYPDSSMTEYYCERLTEVTETKKFNISYSYSYVSDISFYIQNLTEVVTSEVAGDSGYRYNGINPDNYVLFNNEMWRIIGSIPTKQIDETISNSVKIIRNEPIASIAVSSYSNWESSRFYSLLNSYYFAENIEDMNAQDSGYCYFNISYSIPGHCDFRNKGILSSSYYGSMIDEVYWNTGSSVSSNDVGESYVSEKSQQNTSGYIGLMNLSDYGYGTLPEYYWKNLNEYYLNADSYNWLLKDHEYTMTQYDTSTSLYIINSLANANNEGYPLRPVVYLDPSVYVVSGDGTEANPYQIAME